MSTGHDHHYVLRVRWTGTRGEGTTDYRAYARDHVISADGKPDIAGSSDPSFRGDPSRYNPEELLVASLSACHMLWFLHVAAAAGIVVTGYTDDATGTMRTNPNGAGAMTEVTLRPAVVARSPVDPARAASLHERAHALCFIARSVNFPVECRPTLRLEGAASTP
jgi:organic hydroperoxide reductase OsmC/OhrA